MLELKKKLQRLEEVVRDEKAKADVVETQLTRLELDKVDKEVDTRTLLKVTELFKTIGGETQESLMQKVSTFVTYGLQAVFGENYKFITHTSLEGKDVKLDFRIETGELESAVQDAKGGGVSEVVSLLLQLFFVVALGDEYAPFVFLDTAFVHISSEHRPRVSALLYELSTKLNIQIVLIVNDNTYSDSADKVYRFTQKDGKTIVTEEINAS
jgi:hypothetical protein